LAHKTPAIPAAFLALFLAAALPATAQAHGEVGEHVEEFHKHLDDYARDVQALAKQIDRVVEAHRDGDDDAKSLIEDAYFNNFEGLEGGLIEQDPDLVADLEKDFNAHLLGLINGGVPEAEVQAKVDAMKDKLDRAEKLLEQAGDDHGEVF